MREAELTITKINGNGETGCVKIKLQSGNTKLELQLTPLDFAMALMGQANIPCKIIPKTVAPAKPIQNGWALWIDANRAAGRKEDPLPVPKNTAAAVRLLKAVGGDPLRYTAICKAFLADRDRFIVQNGHALWCLAPDKYTNGSTFNDARTAPLMQHGRQIDESDLCDDDGAEEVIEF